MPMKRYRDKRMTSISVKDVQAMERQGWNLIHVSRKGQKLIAIYQSNSLASEVLRELGDDLVDASVPCSRQMIDVYNKTDKSVVALMRVADDDVNRLASVG